MRRRIFWSIFLAALGSVVLLGACVVGLVYRQNSEDTWQDLAAKGYYLAAGMEAEGQPYLEKVRGYTGRITLIAPDGTVLFDDREPAADMENHADRPEVRQALQSGTGRAQRVSGTLGERTLYYALRLPGGEVLRVAASAAGVMGESLNILPWMLVVMGLLALVAGGIARWQTRAILRPINAIDLDHPLQADAYGELSPLLRRIAAQQGELRRQLEALGRQREEFDTVTRNMDEGLVVLNREGLVLSLNPSARRILNVRDERAEGRHILALNRSIALEQAVRGAMEGERLSEVIDLGHKTYLVTASPSAAGGEVGGIVLLFLDESDKMLAEQRRREFSANVSHELKTPLTSISGYAELIQNGVAKPEDVPAFAGRIHGEATRLVALVEDIIKLSRLDEKGGSLEREPVDLYALARKTAESLAPRAREKGMAIEVLGGPAVVSGVRSILDEVLYNLADNAIRYSEGGTVAIRVTADEQTATVTVRDEGIGIPLDQQEQVFERFYRVDKSHSRGGGGTGLGLAIVKRGVLFHGGSVGLESAPGKGSTFSITLPVGGGGQAAGEEQALPKDGHGAGE